MDYFLIGCLVGFGVAACITFAWYQGSLKTKIDNLKQQLKDKIN